MMGTRIIIAILCFVLAAVHSPEQVCAGITLTQSEISTLAQGGLVSRPLPDSGKNSTIAGVSFTVINAPADAVMRALEDVSAWKHIFPNTYEAKTVASNGNTRTVKMRFGNALFKAGLYLTAVFDRQKLELVYALNKKKPHDIEESRGSVKLIPQSEGRTLVAFTSLVKVPFGALINLMGQKVVGWIEYRVLVTPKRLKDWVEGQSGDKYR
ncbi:MAG: hypothetical protein GY854_28020 [Deltaproteobacteria bacterium]|nr:hypothetical protein [Deltaproteobacteria bacterium]